MEINYFPRFHTRQVITFRGFDAGSKTEFTNNSLNSPKIGKLNIDTLIIPQGLSIHEKNLMLLSLFNQRARTLRCTSRAGKSIVKSPSKFVNGCMVPLVGRAKIFLDAK